MNVTIKKIAALAKVSRGTVDRVIHNRAGVKEEVRERVNKILEALDYKPNLAGRALVNTKKNIKIGVVLAPDFNPFVDEIKRGVLSEARKISAFGVELELEVIHTIDEYEQLEILHKLQQNDVAAVAIVPIDKDVIRNKINELVESGTPVVTFNSDISGTKRLCFVGQDNYKAGRTIGGLAAKTISKKASIGIITSNENLLCHKNRVDGFISKIREIEDVTIAGIEQNDDMDEKAYAITMKYIENIKELKLIYVTGGGVGGVGKALAAYGNRGKIQVICHDLIPESIKLLNSSVVDFVIGQDPFSQGSLPIRILFEYLFLGKKPEKEVFFTGVDIFTVENI